MKTVTIILLVFAFCGIHSAEAKTKRCRVGDTWNEQCNKCLCTVSGIPLCTDHNCQLDALHVTSSLGECKPYSRWRVDCNYCSCSESGEVRCTNNICEFNELASRVKRAMTGCTPGTTWKEDCNTCSCGSNGVAACTLKACLSQSPYYPITTVRQTRETAQKACKEGERWKEGCNECFCSKDGKPACTRKACLPEETSGRRKRQAKACKEGERWKEGCNECFCSKDGKPACTRKACLPEETSGRRKRQAKGCTPGTTWKDDCNTCTCSNDGVAACTLKACLSQSPSYPITNVRQIRESARKVCQPGERWQEACNECLCSTDGTPACGRKACLPEESSAARRKRQAKDCTPGATWKFNCNKCTCISPGIATCTIKVCPPESKSDSNTAAARQTRDITQVKGCEQGSRWKEGCNECFCSKDGKPSCTRKACLPEESSGGRKRRQSKGCSPGEKWKESCNTCVCLADGKSSCTRRLCRRKRNPDQNDDDKQGTSH